MKIQETIQDRILDYNLTLKNELVFAKNIIKYPRTFHKMTEVSSKAEDSCAVDRMIILRKIREILEK